MFAALGIDMTVVDKRERPLEFLDGELVHELLHQMRNMGVTFRLGEAVERLEVAESPFRRAVIFLESGKQLVSELVLVSAGRQGATDRLKLPAAGLKADGRGRLTVDRAYRTNVSHIFAEGRMTNEVLVITLIAGIYALRSQLNGSDRSGTRLLETPLKPGMLKQKGVLPMNVLVFALGWLLLLPVVGDNGQAKELSTATSLPPIPFGLDELHSRIDRTHPLLRGRELKTIARGKMLKALGAFEPTLVNDTELERFIPSSDPGKGTQTVGYNDTLIEVLHSSGFRGTAGFRQAIGDARIPDLSFGDGSRQVVLGGFLPLLRGLMINPERAELQRSELAAPRADIKIAQTRQDLFLAAAYQFWEWVAAAKLLDVQNRALAVAQDRYKQVEERANAGAVAAIDVTEAGQEVHRRREVAITARRLLEQEQFKLSMFLWDNGSPTIPPLDRVPDFPVERQMPTADDIMRHKLQAMSERPEVKELEVEAKINNIDLALAKNNLLPSLDLEAAPARAGNLFLGWGIDSVWN